MMTRSASDAAATGDMASRAAALLRANDLGEWTKAAQRLYPHQWSWDSAFIAIGWAQLDPQRAMRELTTLFAAQWETGLVPHIVFNPEVPAESYFPDAARWDCRTLTEAAPLAPATSGLCQPPVHAIAAHRIWSIAQRDEPSTREGIDVALQDLFPRLMAWHRYLATARDPEHSGLVTIVHPWESGTDNSPRWDQAMEMILVGDLPPYSRVDLQHVADPAQRPTNEEYDRYLWLVELLKQVNYDDALIYESHPFLVKDILFSAIFVAANRALLALADLCDASDDDRRSLEEWRDRGYRGLDQQWDAEMGLALDWNVRSADSIRVQTVAGFAPLIAGDPNQERRAAVLATLGAPSFLGHSDLRWPLPPSTSPNDDGFRPRSYWRGPVWPVITWLLWWALAEIGESEHASHLRTAGLAQLDAVGFAESVEPFTGEPLGAADQSWTAAIALDWLAAPDEPTEPPNPPG